MKGRMEEIRPYSGFNFSDDFQVLKGIGLDMGQKLSLFGGVQGIDFFEDTRLVRGLRRLR